MVHRRIRLIHSHISREDLSFQIYDCPAGLVGDDFPINISHAPSSPVRFVADYLPLSLREPFFLSLRQRVALVSFFSFFFHSLSPFFLIIMDTGRVSLPPIASMLDRSNKTNTRINTAAIAAAGM